MHHVTLALPTLPKADIGFPSTTMPSTISRQQKAAIIVRLLLAEGGELSLMKMPEDMQQELTIQMGAMRSVTHETVDAVVSEFISELDSIGLSFIGGLEGALNTLDGSIDPKMVERMRREGGVKRAGDPWEQVMNMEAERLLPVLQDESIEVAAVMLSKLNVSKAAELLGMLPGPRARRITYAVSQTSSVTPDAVHRIGQSLAAQLDNVPVMAFDEGPIERVGAILNFSQAKVRDDVLAGLEEDDKEFANLVRKAIFTFANIPARISPRDVPKITRGVDQAVLVTALAAASAGDYTESTEFILENISKRMAEGIREEMKELGKVKEADGEEAMSAVVAQIRELEAAGEVFFVAAEEDEEEA
ncbi:flagellar motor switch protein FliG [Marinosulfonomonas sp. PRT-SC04]|nr:flagellar motor switch protein FliG [Marinosulfonomonas sp. PRT-SC04]